MQREADTVRALGMLKVAHCVVGTKLSLGASAGTSVTVVEPAV